MPIDTHFQAWRRAKNISISALSEKSGLTQESLELLEQGELDPTVSMVEALAKGLDIPPGWLYGHPNDLKRLFEDDEDSSGWITHDSLDPVTERILLGARVDRELFVLLTTLLQSGEPKLLRAAEVNLRSLVKQSKTATVPWQNRIPGHFEPPTD